MERNPYRKEWHPFLFTLALIVLYTAISIADVWDKTSPKTFWTTEEQREEIILDFGTEQEFGILFYYLGNYEQRTFLLETRTELTDEWTMVFRENFGRPYQWGKYPLNKTGRYLRLTSESQKAQLGELLIKDKNGNVIRPVNAENYPELFDEPEQFSGKFSWRAGTVFDESVFARTAYEFLNGQPAFEDTHPPLGKILIAAGIAVFGMNPLGWRISGIIAGILLLILIWRFSNRLWKDPWISVGVTALLTFDFMHFTESRLGHVDSFLVLFMTGMFYYMYRFYECMLAEDDAPSMKGARLELLKSGVCMGCAIACKWSGCYGAAGLALIWAVTMGRAVQKKKISIRCFWETSAWCVLFFIIIPLAIYLISYIPFQSSDPSLGYWETVLKNQRDILSYHATHDSYHGQGSRWYQWPLIFRPIRLWSVWFPDGTGEFLILMGNPAFWWTGMILFFTCVEGFLEKRNGTLAILFVGFLAPIIPWIGIERSSFIYHYYPSVPFLAMIVGFWADQHGKRGKQVLWLIVAVSMILFILYYPVISGTVISQDYIKNVLEWLPTWEFTKQ